MILLRAALWILVLLRIALLVLIWLRIALWVLIWLRVALRVLILLRVTLWVLVWLRAALLILDWLCISVRFVRPLGMYGDCGAVGNRLFRLYVIVFGQPLLIGGKLAVVCHIDTSNLYIY